jgi:cation:H+ antiporter
MHALLWTFPVLIAASIVIGWAAEVAAVWLSAGIALAVLAWLQTSPEFAVEASIAWARDSHLALANLTGSLRLLLGLGLPMVYCVHWFCERRRGRDAREVRLPGAFAVEALGLLIPVLYFLFIHFKGKWTAWDGMILCSFYMLYFWLLHLQRRRGSQDEPGHGTSDDEPWVVRKLLRKSKRTQISALMAMFVFGAAALYFTVHPFVEALKDAALWFGVNEFVFIQWIAPVASEFPEKITAFNWARRPKRVPYAIVNILSSVTSQWTLLAGFVPILFSLSAHRFFVIELTDFQKTELMLTISQSALVVIFLADLSVKGFEAAGLFVLWLLQLVFPTARHSLIPLYWIWVLAEAVRLMLRPDQLSAFKALRRLALKK